MTSKPGRSQLCAPLPAWLSGGFPVVLWLEPQVCLSMLQVINIINAAQENSPMPVTEALDRVLEILRTTELYSPQFGVKDDDPHASDLVGGLMSVSARTRLLPAVTSCCLSRGDLCTGWAARQLHPQPSSTHCLPPSHLGLEPSWEGHVLGSLLSQGSTFAWGFYEQFI